MTADQHWKNRQTGNDTYRAYRRHEWLIWKQPHYWSQAVKRKEPWRPTRLEFLCSRGRRVFPIYCSDRSTNLWNLILVLLYLKVLVNNNTVFPRTVFVSGLIRHIVVWSFITGTFVHKSYNAMFHLHFQPNRAYKSPRLVNIQPSRHQHSL